MCASPGAAQVGVEVRPAAQTLVCVSQSCKQFGEDEGDAGGRGAAAAREREDVEPERPADG